MRVQDTAACRSATGIPGRMAGGPARGLTADIRARGLLTHEAGDFGERGLSGTLSFDPAPGTERGLSVNLTQTVGGAARTRCSDARRLDARIGYGFGVFEDRYTAIPCVSRTGCAQAVRCGDRPRRQTYRRNVMKRFDVYAHPMLGFEAVKTGFCWPAFFFTWIWMLICRLWVGAIVVFVIASATPFTAGLISIGLSAGADGTATAADVETYEMVAGAAMFAVWFLLSLIVGAKGNEWRRSLLMKRGFDRVKSLQAANADAAISEVSSERKAAET